MPVCLSIKKYVQVCMYVCAKKTWFVPALSGKRQDGRVPWYFPNLTNQYFMSCTNAVLGCWLEVHQITLERHNLKGTCNFVSDEKISFVITANSGIFHLITFIESLARENKMQRWFVLCNTNMPIRSHNSRTSDQECGGTTSRAQSHPFRYA